MFKELHGVSDYTIEEAKSMIEEINIAQGGAKRLPTEEEFKALLKSVKYRHKAIWIEHIFVTFPLDGYWDANQYKAKHYFQYHTAEGGLFSFICLTNSRPKRASIRLVQDK